MAVQPAQPARRCCARARRALARPVGAARAAALAPRHLLARSRRRCALASRDEALAADKAVVLFVDTFNGYFETENAVAAVRVLQAAGYAVHVARRGRRRPRSAAAAPCSPPAWRRARRRRRRALLDGAAAVRRARHRDRRPRAVVPADAARRDAGDGPRRRRRDGGARRRCCSRSSSPAKRAPAASRRRSQPADAADAGAWPLPPEGVRRRAAGARRAAADSRAPRRR